jgi:hypothetical protein
MKRKAHMIGDLLVCTDDGTVFTIGWITNIENKRYTVQWADDPEEYPGSYILKDIDNFKDNYNEYVNKFISK